jgi:hypothetical protein
MAISQEVDPNEIAQFVLRTIREHYNANFDRPLLVADIGGALSFRYKKRFALLWPEETLSEFIANRLSSDVTLMRHRDQLASIAIVLKDHPNVFGIAARDWIEFRTYPNNSSTASLDGTLERFQPWAWAMITKPKARSRERYVSISERKFYDVSPPVDSESARNFVRIDDAFIVPATMPDGAERRRLTVHNLKDWASQNSLNLDIFLDSPLAVESRKEKRETNSTDSIRNFIGMLTEQDQANVQISLASLINILNRLEKGGSE